MLFTSALLYFLAGIKLKRIILMRLLFSFDPIFLFPTLLSIVMMYSLRFCVLFFNYRGITTALLFSDLLLLPYS